MVTTLLDIAGLLLLIAAAFVLGGLWLALAVAGACCLLASWQIEKAKARAKVRR